MNDNVIIAEFYKFSEKDGRYKFSDKGPWIDEIALKFHCNWNWLMPVIKEITSISSTDWDLMTGESVDLFDAFVSNDIDTVYKAVVNFITWYNNNKFVNAGDQQEFWD